VTRFSGVWLALVLLLVHGTTGIAEAQQVEIVSRVHPSNLSDTALGGGGSPGVSGDGRYVVFRSSATHLVPGQKDANLTTDLFVRDQVSGVTTLVSRAASSPVTAANAGGFEAVISADGRYVAWVSEATDVTGPAPAEEDIGSKVFLFDRVTGTNTLVAFSEYFRDNNVVGIEGLAISADGQFVVFSSDAPDYFPEQADGNSDLDVFLYDRVARKIKLISHSSGAPNAAAGGWVTAISADGRYVAVQSLSGDLVPGVVPGDSASSFLYDRPSDSFERIAPAAFIWALSADGRFAAFWSSAPNVIPGQTEGEGNDGADLFLYDRTTRSTVLVNHSLGSATRTSNRRIRAFGPFGMSADGRYLTFASDATDLAPGTSDGHSVFLFDRATAEVTLVSRVTETIFSNVTQAPKISGDGRFIVFWSVFPSSGIFLYDRSSGATALITEDVSSRDSVISANGGFVVYSSGAGNVVPKDFNEAEDLFVYTTATQSSAAVTLRAPEMPSLTPPLASAAQAISADGRYVVFESRASDLIAGQLDRNQGGSDLFLFDSVTKSTLLVSRAAGSAVATGNGESESPSISADGRFVAYASLATDLVAGVTEANNWEDVFLFDRVTGTTTLVSRSAAGNTTANVLSRNPVLSADGRYIAFESQSTDFLPGMEDHNSGRDVFLYERESGSIRIVSRSVTSANATGDGISYGPVLSPDGRYIAFESWARNLVPGQIDPDFQSGGQTPDLFLHDRVTGTTVLVTHGPGSPAVATGEGGSSPAISADGRFLVFQARGDALAFNVLNDESNVYMYDRASGINKLLSPSQDGFSREPVISANGRYVVFRSDGSDLVPGPIPATAGDRLLLFDRVADSLSLVRGTGDLGDLVGRGAAGSPAISADGRFIAFVSSLDDFIRDESAGPDVFLYDQVSGSLALVSRSLGSPLKGAGSSVNPLISADGQKIAFTSMSSDLAAGDFNVNLADAFLFSRTAAPSGPVSVPPCTLLDTRRAGSRPALRSNVPKILTAGGACGVPATAKSVLVKVTVVQPSGKGNLRFFAGNSTASSGILRFQKKRNQSADFTLPLGQGKLTLLPFVAGNGSVHVIMEVRGYVR
jgi:Tol biopolymer transport system component